ncbi:hypothetical protein C8R43DRAFT_1000041 [Mycena crocata]|nr:hypothetical protein C8R43DRAFT_1000041 [Mycena crocata]
MSYPSGYQGLPVAGHNQEHTYGYLTPTDKVSDESSSTGNLAPRRPVRTTSARYVPPSRKKLWAPIVTIVGSFVVGIVFAVAHHAYYSSLSGKPVDTTTALKGLKVYDQKWANHVGTALAFLTKFFFTMCVGAAYVETLWKTARRPLGLSVAGLDASFAILNNPLNFFSSDLLFSAQFLLLLAAISWLVPIVTVFTPGALTVGTEFTSSSVSCSVPGLNLASKVCRSLLGVSFADDFQYAADSLPSLSTVAHTNVGQFSGASQRMRRHATTTLLSGTYIAPTSPCAAGASLCSYSTSYVAPYLQCSDPILGDYTGNLNFKQTGGTTLFNATYLPNTNGGDQIHVAWLVSSSPTYTVNVVTCTAMNATYNVDVKHTSDSHTVDASSVVVNGVLNTDASLLIYQNSPLSSELNSDITRSLLLEATIMAGLQDMLVGTIEASDSSSPSLTLTVNRTMVAMSNLGETNESGRNFTAATDIPGHVTSLLQNVTISLMSNNISDVATTTTCVQSATLNIYTYHPTTLWPPYAAAAACALLATIIGLSAIWTNQTTVDTSFTSMLKVTRNTALDVVPEEDPTRVRLRYGLINDGGEERMAFGQLWNFGDHPLARKEGAA